MSILILFSVSYLSEGYPSFSAAQARDVTFLYFHLPPPHTQSITMSYLFYFPNLSSLHLHIHYSTLQFPQFLAWITLVAPKKSFCFHSSSASTHSS